MLFLALVLSGAGVSAEENDAGYVLVGVECHITGFVLEPALLSYLAVEEGRVFRDLPSLESYAGDINRRLRNNRVFDLASSVTLRLLDAPADGGPRPAELVVDARTSTTAVVVPFPKYNSDDGLSVAVRFKDFNFLGSLETVTANFDYFFADDSFELGGDFALPFGLAGGDWRFSTDFDLLWEDGKPDLDGSVSLSSTYGLAGLGKGWTLKPAISYTYDRDDQDHELSASAGIAYSFTALIPWTLSANASYVYYYLDHGDPYLSGSLAAQSSVVLGDTGFLGPLTCSFSIGPFVQSSLPSFDLRNVGYTATQSLAAGRIDWIGNFRKGAGFSFSATYTYNGIAEQHQDRYDLAFSLNARFFQPFCQVAGLNLRILGRWFADWTLLGDAGDFDWDDEFRGMKDTLRGDLGMVVNLEFPLDLAQGRFFGIEFLSSEVFLNPFLDLGFVRTDPAQAVLDPGQEILCGGAEIIVFPDKARAFSYRLSAGYDLLDLFETKTIALSGLELWLGLGLHF